LRDGSGKVTVAEFVEDAATLETLAAAASTWRRVPNSTGRLPRMQANGRTR
jgi:hypothetical protein